MAGGSSPASGGELAARSAAARASQRLPKQQLLTHSTARQRSGGRSAAAQGLLASGARPPAAAVGSPWHAASAGLAPASAGWPLTHEGGEVGRLGGVVLGERLHLALAAPAALLGQEAQVAYRNALVG